MLHHFNESTDGRQPSSGVTLGSDGRLYGAAYWGGSGFSGTLFAIQRDGADFVVLHVFNAPTDGGAPGWAPLQGADGRLYGTASFGGPVGIGVLYSIEANGSDYRVIHDFDQTAGACPPTGELIQGIDGRLYGIAQSGGAFGGGSVFALYPDGSGFEELHQFNPSTEGRDANAGLEFGSDGMLYGVLRTDGVSGYGALFTVSPFGSGFTVIHKLSKGVDGQRAPGSLTMSPDGKLYGVLAEGGAGGGGTIFSQRLVDELAPEITLLVRSWSYVYGQPLLIQIRASSNPTDYDAINLPPGLAVDHNTGVVSGVPSQVGTFPVTFAASNAFGIGYAEFTMRIVRATASVSIADTIHEFDGFPKSVAVTTTPAGLTAIVTYSGNTVPPTAVGSYDVVATIDDPSYYGSASATLTILPAGQPKITQQPQDFTVALGKNVTFSVSVSSPTPVSYQWRKDGVTIAGATSATLRINRVKATDAGVYYVVVTNAVGTVTSTGATLTITAPPVITSQPVSATVAPGESVSFAVSASGAAPLSYQWRKGGAAIPGATAATLALANVQSADAANYDVVVSNAYGTVVSNTATLSVVAAGVPVITQQPQSQTVRPGRTVTFSVSVSSASSVTYQWLKGGVSISGATSSTLKLTKVTSASAGVYTVTVSNTSGSATSDPAVLTVQ